MKNVLKKDVHPAFVPLWKSWSNDETRFTICQTVLITGGMIYACDGRILSAVPVPDGQEFEEGTYNYVGDRLESTEYPAIKQIIPDEKLHKVFIEVKAADIRKGLKGAKRAQRTFRLAIPMEQREDTPYKQYYDQILLNPALMEAALVANSTGKVLRISAVDGSAPVIVRAKEKDGNFSKSFSVVMPMRRPTEEGEVLTLNESQNESNNKA